MTAPSLQRIPRLPPEAQDEALGFASLRQQALDWVQQASGELWTDYNLHDPGVSLLESLVYALTEEVYAARDSVPALLGLDPDNPGLASAQSAHHYALLPPEQVHTGRPCSELDQLAWLHKQRPAPRHADLAALKDVRGRPLGLWAWRQLGPDQAEDAAQRRLAANLAQRYWQQRNLGEDLWSLPRLLRPRWVRLQLHLVLQEDAELNEVLAPLMLACERYIAALPLSLEADELLRVRADQLHLSDLMRSLRCLPGLRSIELLHLHELGPANAHETDSTTAPSDSLPWRGEDWGLRLHWPELRQDLADWVVERSGARLPLAHAELLLLLQDLRRERSGARSSDLAHRSAPTAQTVVPPAPRLADEGRPARYVPASQHLPDLYREPQALRWTHDQVRRTPPGQATQWAGYLALLEQPLAQLRAQRRHLAKLYDLHNASARSYWQEALDATQLPGLSWLAETDADSPGLLDAQDEAAERRGRALDQLLALHGETLDFGPLQDVPRYLSPRAWALQQLDCKRRYAQQIAEFTGNRQAGFDYSRPGPERSLTQGPPLQRRLALQLQLLAGPRLSQWLQVSGRLPLEQPHSADLQAPESSGHWHPLSHAIPSPEHATEPPSLPDLQAWLGEAADDAALWRAAVRPEAFRCQRHKGLCRLRLGPDAEGRLWSLGEFPDEASAWTRAVALHQSLCRLQQHSEGLHLVEHLLLRPTDGADSPGTLDDFFMHRLSIVLPGWTARCADPRLRALARLRVQEAAPAQLRCRLLWVDAAGMQRFESLWLAWLLSKRAYCQALLDDEAVAGAQRRVDERAAALSAWLRQEHAKEPA